MVVVIDGQYQYVADLDTQNGSLRLPNEAQLWQLNRSAENPARAETFRAAIHAHVPDLVQIPT